MRSMPLQRRIGRRPFLGAALGAAGALAALRRAGGAFIPGSDRIRIGLVGCGGRGTGAALQAASADAGVVVTALGDLFADQVASSATLLEASGHLDCPMQRRFSGADAWLRVIQSDVDAVILAAPPWLRPDHVMAAVRAGRHVYCEKPAAVDVAGIATVRSACAAARQRGLSFVSGLCPRRDEATARTVARIRAGGVGRPLHAAVHARLGLPWRRPMQPGWTALEVTVRNWISCDRLSGGQLVEHHIQALDRAIWALGDDWPTSAEPLVTADGMTGVRYGYDDGRFLDASIDRREGGGRWIEESLAGTVGEADLRRHIVGGRQHAGSGRDPLQACAVALVDSLRSGHPADDGAALCRSTFAALMGRTASATGRRVDWRDLEAAAGIDGRYDRYNSPVRDTLATVPPILSPRRAAPA